MPHAGVGVGSLWFETVSYILTPLPFQRCVTLRATTTECVLLQTVATVRWGTQDQDAQVQTWVLALHFCPVLIQTTEKCYFSLSALSPATLTSVQTNAQMNEANWVYRVFSGHHGNINGDHS